MRMSLEDIRPELRHPALQSAAAAFLDLVAWRCRMVADLRDATGEKHITVVDTNVLLHVYVFGMADRPGSIPAEIVNNFGMPRRTIRDSLALWQRLGFVIREDDGRYHPTPMAAGLFNDQFEDRFRYVAKLCSEFEAYRKAIGR